MSESQVRVRDHGFEARVRESSRKALSGCPAAERRRWILILFLTLLIGLLWFDYGRMVAGDIPSLAVYDAQPQDFVGKPFVVLFGSVSEITASGFRLRKWGSEIEVVGAIADSGIGSIVSVRGTVAADMKLVLEVARVHKLRRLKWLLGVATLVSVAWLFMRESGGHDA